MRIYEFDFSKLEGCSVIDNNEKIWKLKNGDLISEDNKVINEEYTVYEIMTLKFEVYKELTGWEKVDRPYTIYSTGNIGKGLATDLEKDNLNVFSTMDKAQEIQNEQKLYRKIKKFRDENDEQVDWMNTLDDGYYIYRNTEIGIYEVTDCSSMRDLHTIYFTKYELAQKCLLEIVLPFIKNENK